jgi:hypothetical protein
MQWLARATLVVALLACNSRPAGNEAAAAANQFTRQHTNHKLHASVAGSDCHVLLISTDTQFDDGLVESIHYGTSGYDAFGGVEQFAHDHEFRAVVYRDASGNLWTYGATTRDEARSISSCR